MNKFYLILVSALTLTLFGCGDMTLPEPVKCDYYFKLYGGYFSDHLTSTEALSDASVLISGYTVGDGDTTFAYIIKSLPSGMVDWDTTLDWSFSKAHDVMYVARENLIYAAVGRHLHADTSELIMVRFNMAGEIQDTSSTLIKATSINDIKLVTTPNNGVRMFSQIDRNITESDVDSNFIVMHEYNNGIMKKRSKYTVAQKMFGKLSLLTSSADETYITVSVYESLASKVTESTPLDIRLLYFNEGGIVWDKTYGEKGAIETSADIHLFGDEIFIVGNYRQTINSTQELILFRVDFSGFTTNSSYPLHFGIDELETDITATSIAMNPSNNLVFTGSFVTGDNRSDIFFLETTQLGENLNYHSYGTAGDQTGKNVGKTIENNPLTGGYFLAGDLEPIEFTDMCVFSIDEFGIWVH